ncbi:Asp23/Gls24 family envelope stress response protein [Paenibacillus sp. ACRSA]|uniref:Asp23/Gls24 family envelope stress response protein n=1 Tax=Paenibacillus sp. ACRSA TaxID=2918211 RepID=UPI001EF3FD45|nr:Asp23/Gls24 family envelope stress response protein [Paenibacillus sp. ACRSA]MCG7376429.1 Asp23/Gls24 family envelope stress response protein [Paenibacillus sp. ACRSA]
MLIQNVLGKTTFSKEVVSKIIGKTVSMTEGIGSLSTGIVESLAQKLTGKRIYNGIELREQDTGLDIQLSVIVRYGIRMQEVCRDLQENVRAAVENFTGLPISTIHIKIEGIDLGTK